MTALRRLTRCGQSLVRIFHPPELPGTAIDGLGLTWHSGTSECPTKSAGMLARICLAPRQADGKLQKEQRIKL